MVPELEQITREVVDFFTSYKPVALTAMIVVPASIGYGVSRLLYNPTADKYFEKLAGGIIRITGVEKRIRRHYEQLHREDKL